MENNDQEIVSRLRALGEQPIDPGLAARHTSFLAAASPVAARTRRRPAVTAAFVAGVLLGGTGLAAAVPGPLPTQATSVAKSALKAVQLADDEPKDPAKAARAAAKAAGGKGGGVARYSGPECTGMPAGPYNHGQYVKAHPDDPATLDRNERQEAAESRCGKPMHAGDGAGAEDKDKGKSGENKPEDAGKPAETGRPESPGNSETSHPPATAEKEQGTGNRSTDAGNAGEAGKAEENRPEGVGPPGS